MGRQFVYEWLSLCLLLTSFAGSLQGLQFTKEPSDTSVSSGSDYVLLDCAVDDGSKVSWYKDDSAITEDFDKYTFATSGLIIKPVEKSDAGKYYCKAGALKSKVASLTVEYICKDKFKIKASVVFRDGNATLTCECPAIPTPSYTWQKDDNPLSFQGKELVITNAQKSKDDGKYVCIVNNGKSQVKSLPHVLDVLNCSPPKIVHPPDEKTPFVVNKPLTVRCDATGDPKPVVKWFFGDSSTALTNTSRIHILSSGALHFTKMRQDDIGEYQCTAITDGCYSSSTFKTKLVLAKIARFSPMEDVLSRVGSPVSITCNPSSKSFPKVTNITWQLSDGNPLPTDPRFNVDGFTLQIANAQREDSKTYTCVAKNIAGEKTVDVKLIVAVYPQATLDPTNKTVIEGESVSLECKFSGDPEPTITWEKNEESFPDDADTTIVQSGSSSIITIKNAVGEQSGKYRCVAKLKHITERTNEATLTVKEKIALAKIGAEKFDVGKNAKLNCMIVKGEPPYNIRWTKHGLNGLLPRMKVEGSKLIINKVEMSDSGNYSCHINNSFSSGSLTFGINIYVYTKIVLKPRNVTVKTNGTALFNCRATGIPEPGIQWFSNNKDKIPYSFQEVNFTTNLRAKRLPNNSILLTNVQKEDSGWYQCIAGNPGYLEQAVAHLKVGLDKLKTTAPTGTKNKSDDHHEADDMGKTVGIAVGCAGAYIILVVGLMIYCKGRRARQAKNKLIVNGEDMPLKPADEADNVEVVKAPEVNAKEYPRENLETLRTLGSGTYGNVFLAKAPDISEGEGSSIVVVQSLTSEEAAVKKDFLRRMDMLSLKHENIAKLLGVCQEENPMYLISEYPEQGDLKTVMRDSSTPLNPTQKVNICAAVASGMNYLCSHNYVHKDLAARNCLVNKAFDVKISFLSLNQGTYPKEYYKHNGELIPLRWMAPEALEGDYSDMSDVWSFGVLMWEVYSEGMLPYEERPDKEVLHSVVDDLRLTKPEGCPGKIYKLMEKCWADEKEYRITFGQLCEEISEIPRESDF